MSRQNCGFKELKMKLKGTVKAWTTSRHKDFDFVSHLIKEGKKDEACSALFYSNSDMEGVDGWVEVGVATITVELFQRDYIVANQVNALREQLRQHRLEADLAEQALLSEIRKLTAITA
jgi:hypothetical protein